MSEPKSTAHGGQNHACCAGHAKSALVPAGSEQALDPVCGMTVDPAATQHHADHDGKGAIWTCPMHPRSGRRGRELPDLRHGAGAEVATADSRPQPRTCRHDAALLDRLWPSPCRCSCSKWAGICSRRCTISCRADIDLDPARAGDAGGPLGRLAVLRARLGVAGQTATSTCSR
jgi:hypothetical protein